MTIYQINDNGVNRDMTDNEIVIYQKAAQQIAVEAGQRIAALEAIVAAKASARAKLKALGLTDDEIAALVG